MGGFSLAHEAQLARALAVARDIAAAQPHELTAASLASALYGRWYAAPATSLTPAGPSALAGTAVMPGPSPDGPRPAEASGRADASGRDAARPSGTDPSSPRGRLPLAAILRAAHPDADVWTSAVVVQAGIRGAIAVRTGAGGIRAIARGDWAPAATDGLGRPPVAGDRVVVRAREGGLVEGGWWRTWGGGCGAGRAPAGSLTRIYLAPRPEAVHRLVPAVLGVLAALDTPWLVKVGAEWPMLSRPDGAVVYLPDPVAGLASGAGSAVVAGLLRAVAGLVHGPGPALTAPLAEGVSWVADPGDGSSFGETVCRVLAAALIDRMLVDPIPSPREQRSGSPTEGQGSAPAERHASASTQCRDSVPAERPQSTPMIEPLVLAHLADALTAAGIDPSAPHLRACPKEAA